MFKVIALVSFIACAAAQYAYPDPYNGIPNPYQFSYTAPSIGGASSHQEQGDGLGRVTGSYSLAVEDGRQRIVEYVADELGFRANVVTNEPGTSNHASAGVNMYSSADEGLMTYNSAPLAGPVAAPAYGGYAGYGGYGGRLY